MKHIKKVLSYSIAGSIGLTVIASLQGCSDQGVPPGGDRGFGTPQGAGQEQNAFLVIEQTGASPDTYQKVSCLTNTLQLSEAGRACGKARECRTSHG